jgi:DNA-directed RNA polymerase subunit RPC12/RpoP
MGKLSLVAEDLGYLTSYYKCTNCQTIIISHNHQNMKVMNKYDCPVCSPKQGEFPFEFVTPDRLDKYKVPASFMNKHGKIKSMQISLRQRLEELF